MRLASISAAFGIRPNVANLNLAPSALAWTSWSAELPKHSSSPYRLDWGWSSIYLLLGLPSSSSLLIYFEEQQDYNSGKPELHSPTLAWSWCSWLPLMIAARVPNLGNHCVNEFWAQWAILCYNLVSLIPINIIVCGVLPSSVSSMCLVCHECKFQKKALNW